MTATRLILILQCFLFVSTAAVSHSVADYFNQFYNEVASKIKFEPYRMPVPANLTGPLSPNTILDRAELVFDGEFEGPECIAYRGNELYTGVTGGFIVRVHQNGTWEKVVQTGKPCAGPWEMNICGKPLGMRFDASGRLIVADATQGLLSIDVDRRTVEILIPRYGSIENGNEDPLNFADDLDIGSDGTIYFSDVGQHTTSGIDFVSDVIGNPTGRLIKYDPQTGQSKVLMKNVRFANGVQLSRKEDFVALSEFGMGRVWKYQLTGPQKGQIEILVDNLPGIPDNIRPNGKGGFYVSLFFTRNTEKDNFRTLAPLWWLRQFIFALQRFTVNFFQRLYDIFPNQILGQWLAYSMQFGELGNPFAQPRKVIIVEIDENGNILGSLQNRLSAISTISTFEGRIGQEYSYFGSPTSLQFWRIKTDLLH